MITLSTIIAFIIIFFAVMLWQSAARAREMANRICKYQCKQHDVQFLDGTTVQEKWAWCRGDDGKLGIMRRFHFSFYNGKERLKGKITIFKNEVTELYLENSLPTMKHHDMNLFTPANETSNVIPFPKQKKDHKDEH